MENKKESKGGINLQIKPEEKPEFIKTVCYLIANGKEDLIEPLLNQQGSHK